MQIELDRSLLGDARLELLSLLALCAFGLQGRHRVVPDDRAIWEHWARNLPRNLADEVLHAWDLGEARSSVGQASLQLRVCADVVCNLRGRPIVATPDVALALLGRPLRILLENSRNDRAFLLAFCDRETKRIFLHAEREGWLVFDTAGGIGEIKVRLSSILDGLSERPAQAEALRTLYLCDSDARELGKPSEEAEHVQKCLDVLHAEFARHLDQAGWLGWVLTRRAAENYAPAGDVLRWATLKHGPKEASALIDKARTPEGRAFLVNGVGSRDSSRRHLLAAVALSMLSGELRSVLCMKQGRGDDPPRTLDSVWSQLDPFQASALKDGFGRDFSANFYNQAEHLHDGTGEIAGVLKNILERL